ncbi:MAG: hypothetical protein ACO39S_09390 [Steroidobacteraceae bacterium]
MTHKIKLSAIAGAVVLALGAQGALAASENANAEFAAVYSEYPIVLAPRDGTDGVSNFANCIVRYTGGQTAPCIGGIAEPRTGKIMAQIKVAQNKELLVGLSAQMEIFTGTTVTGKRGSRSTSMAAAGGAVELHACTGDDGDGGYLLCRPSLSGAVMLSRRAQELTAVLGGVLEQCNVNITETDGSFSGEFALKDCQVAEEEIGLALTTIASHHYNFLFPNLDSGTWDVVATFLATAAAEGTAGCADGSGNTELTGCYDKPGASADSQAYVIISKSTMTVQEVRANKAWEPVEL